MVCVGELEIVHPGQRPIGYGLLQGRHYRMDTSGRWLATMHVDDCPCGYDALHAHHLVVADHFEGELRRSQYQPIRVGIQIYNGLNPDLSLAYLKESDDSKPYFSDMKLASNAA